MLFIDLVHRDIKPENILLVKNPDDLFDIRVSYALDLLLLL